MHTAEGVTNSRKLLIRERSLLRTLVSLEPWVSGGQRGPQSGQIGLFPTARPLRERFWGGPRITFLSVLRGVRPATVGADLGRNGPPMMRPIWDSFRSSARLSFPPGAPSSTSSTGADSTCAVRGRRCHAKNGCCYLLHYFKSRAFDLH